MKKKIFATVLFFIAIGLLVTQSVRAYTYDGEIDPKQFFTYEPLFVEPLSPITALMVLGKEGATPRYAVVCLARVPGGVVILAYAYYDADFNLKHFIIDKENGHYVEKPFDATVPGEVALENKLRKLLNAFHGIASS